MLNLDCLEQRGRYEFQGGANTSVAATASLWPVDEHGREKGRSGISSALRFARMPPVGPVCPRFSHLNRKCANQKKAGLHQARPPSRRGRQMFMASTPPHPHPPPPSSFMGGSALPYFQGPFSVQFTVPLAEQPPSVHPSAQPTALPSECPTMLRPSSFSRRMARKRGSREGRILLARDPRRENTKKVKINRL